MNTKRAKGCTTTTLLKLARKRQTSKKQQHESVSKVRRFKWTVQHMEAAVSNVIGGSMSQREAAQKYCVPRTTTLQKIIKEKNTFVQSQEKSPCLELSCRPS